MKQHENHLKIKDQISKIKASFQKSKILNFSFVILLFTFCFLNLISSQLISPLYFQITNNNEKSTVSFLQKIKTLPEYQKILKMNDNIFGLTLKETILKQENEKKEMINNLEQKLKINPRSRDILYSLYKLYFAEGDRNKANDYLQRAKEVDPSIK